MQNLNGKNALITGSSRGIGKQIALGLAKLGCNIVVHGRKMENCTKTLMMLKKFPVNVYVVEGNLSEKKEVEDIIEQVLNLNISIDILYNNAAIMTQYHKNYSEHSWEEWIETYKVNVIAIYELCCAFIPGMIERNFGRIINLTSRIKDTPELAPYGASKWAVDKITDDLASKLRNSNVKISNLDPGWLKTDMGGVNADHPVEAVLPGALAPALIEKDAPNGQFFSAINHNLDISKFK